MAKILIIDDDDLMAKLYKKALMADGHDVLTVNDVNEGIKKAKEVVKPDLILLDLMMPIIDGMEALKMFKKDPNIKDIPIVMLTNLTWEDKSKDALEAGAYDYIIKMEAKPNILKDRVKEILNKLQTERKIT
jgi:CheY-like chemotaxis protein